MGHQGRVINHALTIALHSRTIILPCSTDFSFVQRSFHTVHPSHSSQPHTSHIRSYFTNWSSSIVSMCPNHLNTLSSAPPTKLDNLIESSDGTIWQYSSTLILILINNVWCISYHIYHHRIHNVSWVIPYDGCIITAKFPNVDKHCYLMEFLIVFLCNVPEGNIQNTMWTVTLMNTAAHPHLCRIPKSFQ